MNPLVLNGWVSARLWAEVILRGLLLPATTWPTSLSISHRGILLSDNIKTPKSIDPVLFELHVCLGPASPFYPSPMQIATGFLCGSPYIHLYTSQMFLTFQGLPIYARNRDVPFTGRRTSYLSLLIKHSFTQ